MLRVRIRNILQDMSTKKLRKRVFCSTSYRRIVVNIFTQNVFTHSNLHHLVHAFGLHKLSASKNVKTIENKLTFVVTGNRYSQYKAIFI